MPLSPYSPLSIASAVDRYEAVRDAVKMLAPDQWWVVTSLCQQVPQDLSPELFWVHGRDKPCYSFISVPTGDRIAADLQISADFELSANIASSVWAIRMIARGRKWKASRNFAIEGPSAIGFWAQLQQGGLRSYPWRMFAIREFAKSLQAENGTIGLVRQAVTAGEVPVGPPTDPGELRAKRFDAWVRRFADRAGQGWGTTTVNHMLTDLGRSVKPDRHLRRSLVRMGLLANLAPPELPIDAIDAMARTLDGPAVHVARELAAHIEPLAVPGNPRTSMREIDKVLMEWSRQGMLTPLPL
jgi:hypothetical protein